LITLGAKRTGKLSAGRSSQQGCNPAGGSPAVSIAHVGHVAMPHLGVGTTRAMRGVNGPAARQKPR
ncbi:hypothetical protein, partial [Petrachloros mirabilis]